jgi:hypothetical protein
MTALTAESSTIKAVLPGTILMPLATAVRCWKGGIVSIDNTGTPGYVEPASDTAGTTPYGIAESTAPPAGVSTAGASGTYSVVVTPFTVQPVIELNYGAGDADQADVGQFVYITDDNTCDLVGVPTNDIILGMIIEVISVTRVVVDTRLQYTPLDEG